ncbi:MAG TPA: class I SAM-dependent methyltransferase, partial [Terriglobales bacterium]|nr:class I SAM-dependent methyltransferase [Terriglobales bacterium]
MKRIYKAFRKKPSLGFRVIMDRAADWIEERRLGIDTCGLIPIETLLANWAGNHDYAPTTMSAFRAFMSKIDFRADGEEVFLDYGCGKGRALIMAAQYPFRRVIGIEIASVLVEAARKNIAHVLDKLPCKQIEIRCARADQAEVPPDASVVYLFNPFHGSTLERVIANIRSSLERNPRRLRLIY